MSQITVECVTYDIVKMRIRKSSSVRWGIYRPDGMALTERPLKERPTKKTIKALLALKAVAGESEALESTPVRCLGCKTEFRAFIRDPRAFKPYCSDCSVWLKRTKLPKFMSVRYKGTHYTDAGQCSTAGVRGSGGEVFEIRFKNGKTIQTSNLWNNGTIPKAWRKQLPDNARVRSIDNPDSIKNK